MTKSIPGFKNAFAAALAGRDEKILKEAPARLAQEYIYKNDMPDFDYWERVAKAALTRGSPDPHLESWIDHSHCVALNRLGRIKERLRCFEEHAKEVARPAQRVGADDARRRRRRRGPILRSDRLAREGRRLRAEGIRRHASAHARDARVSVQGMARLGEYGKALSECQSALRTVREVSPDNQYLVTRIQLYLGSTLREMKQYADAKKILLEAQKGVKDEVLPELARDRERDRRSRRARSTTTRSRSTADDKELPATHPDLVGERTMYAETLMAMGQLEPARAQLELAYKALNDDMSPFQLADVSFDYARALWLTRPDEHGKALQLARIGAADLRRERAEDRALPIGAGEDRQVAGERSRPSHRAAALTRSIG